MANFFIGIASSVVAGILLLVVTALFSQTFRLMISAAVTRALRIDVEHVFDDQASVASDLVNTMKRSDFAWIMTGRGLELQGDTFAHLLLKPGRRIDLRVLLPDPRGHSGPVDWIDDRSQELAAFDQTYRSGDVLRTQIETTIRFLADYGDIVDLRVFDFPHLGRIIVTSKAAYLTPYSEHAHGRDCPVIKYRAGGETYNFLRRLFNKVWKTSQAWPQRLPTPEAPAPDGQITPRRLRVSE